jgi:hypothetical protein
VQCHAFVSGIPNGAERAGSSVTEDRRLLK